MRPYRWQDPAPAPVAAIRERRMHRLFVAEHGPFSAAETAPEQPSMVLDGVEYVEAPEPCRGSFCEDCAFEGDEDACVSSDKAAKEAFGGSCEQRRVIYIRKA